MSREEERQVEELGRGGGEEGRDRESKGAGREEGRGRPLLFEFSGRYTVP